MTKTIREFNIPIADIKQFEVTGVLYQSTKRFKKVYSSFDQAMMINLWNGSVWARLNSGKKVLIKRVQN
jgi:hypothetical protein